jgi:hypothetical protein
MRLSEEKWKSKFSAITDFSALEVFIITIYRLDEKYLNFRSFAHRIPSPRLNDSR